MAIHTVHTHITTTTDGKTRDHHHLDERRHHDTPNHHYLHHDNTPADIQHYHPLEEPVHHDDATEVLEDDPMKGTYSTDTTGLPNTLYLHNTDIEAYHLPTRPTLAGHHRIANAITNLNPQEFFWTVPVQT